MISDQITSDTMVNTYLCNAVNYFQCDEKEAIDWLHDNMQHIPAKYGINVSKLRALRLDFAQGRETRLMNIFYEALSQHIQSIIMRKEAQTLFGVQTSLVCEFYVIYIVELFVYLFKIMIIMLIEY